jgi:hypothetical protein
MDITIQRDGMDNRTAGWNGYYHTARWKGYYRTVRILLSSVMDRILPCRILHKSKWNIYYYLERWNRYYQTAGSTQITINKNHAEGGI